MEVSDWPQAPAAFPQGKERLYPFNRRIGWPQSRSGCFAEQIYIYIYIYIYHLKLPGLFSYCADYGTPAAGDKRVVIGKLKRTASNSSSLFSLDPGTRAVQYMFHHRPSKVRSQTMCNCVSNTVQ